MLPFKDYCDNIPGNWMYKSGIHKERESNPISDDFREKADGAVSEAGRCCPREILLPFRW